MKYVSHTVVYVFHTVKQRILLYDWKKRDRETEVWKGVFGTTTPCLEGVVERMSWKKNSRSPTFRAENGSRIFIDSVVSVFVNLQDAAGSGIENDAGIYLLVEQAVYQHLRIAELGEGHLAVKPFLTLVSYGDISLARHIVDSAFRFFLFFVFFRDRQGRSVADGNINRVTS